MVAVATDLLSLALLKPPGEMGADIVLGSAQRFGVPMGFGGPHAAFFATRDQYKRSAPVGSSGFPKTVEAKSPCEWRCRRGNNTSAGTKRHPIFAPPRHCWPTWQSSTRSIMVPRVSGESHSASIFTRASLEKLSNLGFAPRYQHYFDTLWIQTDLAPEIYERALQLGLNLRQTENGLGISLDETTTLADINVLLHAFAGDGEVSEISAEDVFEGNSIPGELCRSSDFLTHEVFNSYHCETEMLRYLKRLENRDFSLAHGMIPLGSCTMKLNATTEMIPVSWTEFANLHPFAPREQWQGYEIMIDELRKWLIEITGYDAMSMQPNSGAQGEYAGLLAIRRYHESLAQGHRTICLIPSSAHGTNPASASMMGLDVVVVGTDENGNIDLDDLRAKAAKHGENLSSLMITYPSTHGVFEETVRQACEIVHSYGGQVYLDGAKHERAGWNCGAGPHRGRRIPPQPAQDILYSARWRRSREWGRSASSVIWSPFCRIMSCNRSTSHNPVITEPSQPRRSARP